MSRTDVATMDVTTTIAGSAREYTVIFRAGGVRGKAELDPNDAGTIICYLGMANVNSSSQQVYDFGLDWIVSEATGQSATLTAQTAFGALTGISTLAISDITEVAAEDSEYEGICRINDWARTALYSRPPARSPSL